MSLLVSVNCITYNHEEYIADAIESFLMQKTYFGFEILIGEDCSTDNTREIVMDYGKAADIVQAPNNQQDGKISLIREMEFCPTASLLYPRRLIENPPIFFMTAQ